MKIEYNYKHLLKEETLSNPFLGSKSFSNQFLQNCYCSLVRFGKKHTWLFYTTVIMKLFYFDPKAVYNRNTVWIQNTIVLLFVLLQIIFVSVLFQRMHVFMQKKKKKKTDKGVNFLWFDDKINVTSHMH